MFTFDVDDGSSSPDMNFSASSDNLHIGTTPPHHPAPSHAPMQHGFPPYHSSPIMYVIFFSSHKFFTRA